MQISASIARRFVLTRQHLAGPRVAPTVAGIVRIVRNLKYVQLDPTTAVARSHLLVLWSRLGPYDPAVLDRLLWKSRRLLEYSAFIVPAEDYAIYRPRMRKFATGNSPWRRRVRAWMAKNSRLRRHVLTALRTRGPLASDEFEDHAVSSWQSSGWTAGRNVNRMLEFLGASGVLVVAGRRGGQRVWDLASHALPPRATSAPVTEREAERRRTLNALAALGIARAGHLRAFYVGPRMAGLPHMLAALEQEGTIARVEIAGDGPAVKGFWWVRTRDLPLLRRLESGEAWIPRTTLLSPFDNLIINRPRIEELFKFHFRMEIYVPKRQRRFGYFVMPILHGDRLIGRIDPVFDRERRQLRLNGVFAEPDAPQDRSTGAAIAGAVESLAEFLGAEDIVYPSDVPSGWKGVMR